MRVKIGNTWFEATRDQPICIELNDRDKRLIAHMETSASKYAVFADDDPRDADSRRVWMA